MKQAILIGLLVISFVLVGCASEPTQTTVGISVKDQGEGNTVGGVYQVVVDNLGFMPDSITVEKGATIEWVNKGEVAHTLTFEDGSLADVMLVPGSTVTQTFTTSGVYAYASKFTQNVDDNTEAATDDKDRIMNGIVVVQ